MKDTKQFLKQVKSLDVRISAKIIELQAIKEKVTKITPTLSDTGGTGGGNSSDKLGAAVAKMIDLEREINLCIDEYVDKREYINNIINNLEDPDEYQVIHKRYFEGMTFEEIACALHMSYRNICYIHGRGLANVEKLRKKHEN